MVAIATREETRETASLGERSTSLNVQFTAREVTSKQPADVGSGAGGEIVESGTKIV
jgi:hypothetical protein